MVRIEAPNEITGVNPKLFIHGSTENRDWRDEVLADFTGEDVIILDPWRNSWDNYINSYTANLNQSVDYSSNIISETTFNPGTGVADGATIPDFPDIQFFWENKAIMQGDYGLFIFNNEDYIANHILIQLMYFLTNKKANTFVAIPNEDWRINISFLFKNIENVNFYADYRNAIAALKESIL